MGKWVDVQQGQTLLNLAFENRIYRWETIWEHGENASLRAARANPQVLAPGDRIYIPSLAELQKQEVVATGAAHVFKLQVVPSFLTLYVLDEQGQPHAGRRYKMTAGGRTFEGSIPADGCVRGYMFSFRCGSDAVARALWADFSAATAGSAMVYLSRQNKARKPSRHPIFFPSS